MPQAEKASKVINEKADQIADNIEPMADKASKTLVQNAEQISREGPEAADKAQAKVLIALEALWPLWCENESQTTHGPMLMPQTLLISVTQQFTTDESAVEFCSDPQFGLFLFVAHTTSLCTGVCVLYCRSSSATCTPQVWAVLQNAYVNGLGQL